MIKHVFLRYKQAPLYALAILLFAATASTILCTLHRSGQQQQIKYAETYETISVTVSITNLSATKNDDLNIPGWMADLFRPDSKLRPSLDSYLKDVCLKSSHQVLSVNGASGTEVLVGLSAVEMEKRLLPENGTVIRWKEGYDASVFATDTEVCIVPEDMYTGNETLVLAFEYVDSDGSYGVEPTVYNYTCSLQIVGTYSGNSDALYCPYLIVERVYSNLMESRTVDAVCATLRNNNLLEELRVQREHWFAEPNPTGAKTPWGFADYTYYPYALEIDDSLLTNATEMLHRSILINRLCAILTLIFSGAAAFIAGFLMVRARKHEINLMRSLGKSKRGIYLEFCLEQMCCVVTGMLVGGAAFALNAWIQLILFAGTYFLGLTAALLIHLNKNLLITTKEDE